MLESLEQFSNIALFSAMAVYAIAFVFYVIDFAGSSASVPESAVRPKSAASESAASAATLSQSARMREPVAAGVGAQGGLAGAGASADTSVSAQSTAAATVPARVTRQSSSSTGGFTRGRRSVPLRIGFALTVLGFLFHAVAVVLRGIGAGRVPYANMYEFAITGTLAIVLIFLLVQFFVDLRFLGSLVTGLTLLFLGITRTNFYVSIVPLPAALDSYWLVIHISVAVLSVGFLTISFGLSVLQLLQHRREAQLLAGTGVKRSFLSTLPKAVRIEDIAYRVAIIGFIFWSFTLVAGSIWAERAWTRYWGWDVKEVWTFVIWVLYAGYIHARATRGWRGARSAWLCIIAYATVIFNFTIVNVFFNGLHSYSGL